MTRRLGKLTKIGLQVVIGSALGAVAGPLIMRLRSKGELHVGTEPTCNGTAVILVIGPPCEHVDDGGGGPEASNPTVETDHIPWHRQPGQRPDMTWN